MSKKFLGWLQRYRKSASRAAHKLRLRRWRCWPSFERLEDRALFSATVLAVADFNGDGKLDLVVPNATAGTVSVLLGHGDGTFSPASGSPYTVGSGDANSGPYQAVVGDFNNDGKLDLAVTDPLDGTVAILRGNGDGTFLAPTFVSIGSGALPMGLATADFNKEGKLDLVVANYQANSISVLLGNGDGTFAVGSPISVTGNPVGIAAGDFNGDGNPDLAVASTDGSLNVLLGNGTGGFTAASGSPIHAGSSLRAVAVADFNGDGIPDLAVSDKGTSQVTVLLGRGDATFFASAYAAVGAGPWGIATADFNNDGKTDLVTANSGGNNASLLIGNGNGTFRAAVNVASSVTTPIGVGTGDFNNNGTADVVLSQYATASTSVLLDPYNADLGVTVSAPATLTAGLAVSYTITVTNSGPLDAANVSVTDAVPTFTTFQSDQQLSGPTATFSNPQIGQSGTVTISMPTLAAGASAVFQVVMLVNPHLAATTPIYDTAIVSSATPDTNASNNHFTVESHVATSADVWVTLAQQTQTTITYTIQVGNAGPSDAQGVVLNDPVPAHTTFQSFTQTAGPAFTLSAPQQGGTGTASASIATLGVNVPATFQLVVAITAGTHNGITITDTAVVTSGTSDPNTSNNSASVSTLVVAEAPISVNVLPIQAVAGQTFSGLVAGYGPGEPTDPPTATIDWGDGLTSAGIVSETSIQGTHSYANTGSHTVTVRLVDPDGDQATGTAPVLVTGPPVAGLGNVIHAVTAQQFTATVAVLAISPAPGAGGQQVIVDWGDTSTSVVTLGAGGPQGYPVSGTHTYAVAGSFTITVRQLGQNGAILATGSVLVTDSPLSGSGVAINATEGQPFIDSIASFSSPDPNASYGDFQAWADWGDGHVTGCPVSGTPASGFSVSRVGYVYAEEGNYTVSVSIRDRKTGGWLQVTAPASVQEAPLLVQAFRGAQSLSGHSIDGIVGAFSESSFDPRSDFGATIDWGDGTTSLGTVKGPADYRYQDAPLYGGYDPELGSPVANYPFFVVGTHDYAVSPFSVQTFDITVRVTDQQDGATASASAAIDATAPGLRTGAGDAEISVQAQDIHASEGQTFSGRVATFTDPGFNIANPEPDTAFIDWGDGTGNWTADGWTWHGDSRGIIGYSADGTSFSVSGHHVYGSDQIYPLQVIVFNPYAYPGWATGNATATVAEVPVQNVTIVAQSAPLTLSPGASLGATPVATFTFGDSSATFDQFTATVNGDPAVVTGSNGQFGVLYDHTFSAAGNFFLAIAITHRHRDDGGQWENDNAAATQTSLTVGGGSVQASGTNLTGTSGTALSAVIATGTLPPGITMPTATIQWGDGATSAGSFLIAGDSYQVTGTHSYMNPGLYTANVIVGAGDLRAEAISPVTVNAAGPPTGSLVVTGSRVQTPEGMSLNAAVVATFTDANPDDPGLGYTTSIYWGDGATGAGTVVPVSGLPGTYQVIGSHTYTDSQAYPLVVTVSDAEKARSAYGFGTVLAIDAPLSATGTTLQIARPDAVLALDGRQRPVVLASFTDPDPLARASDFVAHIGLTGAAVQVVGGGGLFYVVGDPGLAPGSYQLAVTVTDDAASAQVLDTMFVAQEEAGVAGESIVPPGPVFMNPVSTEFASKAQINWGDGGQTTDYGAWPNSIGAQGIAGAGDDESAEGPVEPSDQSLYYPAAYDEHIFSAPGTYHVSATVKITEGDQITGSGPAYAIGDARLMRLATTPSLFGTEGVALTDVPLAAFADDDPTCQVATFSATIAWGDGSSSTGQVMGGPGGPFWVRGSHTYASGGQYAPVVLVQDAGGAQLEAGSQASISDAPAAFQGQAFGALVHKPTGDIRLATFQDPGHLPADFSATIAWGDGYSTAGTVVPNPDGSFQVTGGHTYASAGVYAVLVTLNDTGGGSHFVFAQATVLSWSLDTTPLTNDPAQALLLPIGEAQVALNTGGLRLSQPLDFDQSPGTSVGGDPALVYNSDTVSSHRVVRLQLASDPLQPVPDQIQVALNWEGQGPQAPITFSTSGHNPGDAYVLAIPADGLVTTSGLYDWQAQVTFVYGTGAHTISVPATVSGESSVVAAEASPYGAGWGLAGVDRLLPVEDGVLWITGAGDARLFAQGSGNQYTSPAGDFGTLVKGTGGSFTYTAKDQTRWLFNAQGLLTSVVDTHGLALSYGYDSAGDLTQVTAPDTGVTTLNYSGGLLSSIVEPGGRTLTFGHTGSDLTSITDAAGMNRTLAYDGGHHVVEDQWAPLDTAFRYTGDVLTGVDQGLNTSWNITPVVLQGTQSAAVLASQAAAQVINPRGLLDTYTLDARGELLAHQLPDGATQTWSRNLQGGVTSTTDALSRTTTYTLNSSDDVLAQTAPDGATWNYTYDPVFHHVLTAIDPLTTGVTVNTYDPVTGDLLSSADRLNPSDPLIRVTTYHWLNGLLTGVIDPMGRSTVYGYYAGTK